jgi:hypothetical protein
VAIDGDGVLDEGIARAAVVDAPLRVPPIYMYVYIYMCIFIHTYIYAHVYIYICDRGLS